MNVIILRQVEHSVKIGQKTTIIEPNIVDDCLFVDEQGAIVGFYLTKLPSRAEKFLKIANNEFNSNRVPKSVMNRSSSIMRGYEESGKSGKPDVNQMSAILGGVPPRPHMRRPYPSISSVHGNPQANNFIKAMLGLSRETTSIINQHMPEVAKLQKDNIAKADKNFQFGDLFTSAICNYNISVAYHRDTGNLKRSVNAIYTKRKNSTGGSLHVPDHNACIEQADNSLLVYPAWRNVHGVTPIELSSKHGYRNSLVFYALSAFINE